MRIGLRAHDFGKLPAAELAQHIAAQGLESVQLNIGASIAGVDGQPGCLSPGLANHVRKAFDRAGVGIAALSCYVNPIHPDAETRAANLARFKEHLRFARGFGCGVVALESGSLNADYSPHKDNHTERAFRQTVASLAELTEEAERFGVLVGIEGVTSHVLGTPELMYQALQAVDSPNLQVVLDPVNLINNDNYKDQRQVMEKVFELYGDRIIIIHAKDFIVENGAVKAVHCGRGIMDYPYILSVLKERKPFIDVILEGVPEDAAEECVKYLNGAADQSG